MKKSALGNTPVTVKTTRRVNMETSNLQIKIRDNKDKHPPTTAYGPHLRVQLKMPDGQGRTKRQFKDECDINVIMRRYAQTGTLEHVRHQEAQYADVTGHDFQKACDVVATARTMFAELPAHVRDRFKNDPQEFLEFVHDEDNLAEARELGLLSPEAIQRLDEKERELVERTNRIESEEIEKDLARDTKKPARQRNTPDLPLGPGKKNDAP